jgi:hypothetical protein
MSALESYRLAMTLPAYLKHDDKSYVKEVEPVSA